MGERTGIAFRRAASRASGLRSGIGADFRLILQGRTCRGRWMRTLRNGAQLFSQLGLKCTLPIGDVSLISAGIDECGPVTCFGTGVFVFQIKIEPVRAE